MRVKTKQIEDGGAEEKGEGGENETTTMPQWGGANTRARGLSRASSLLHTSGLARGGEGLRIGSAAGGSGVSPSGSGSGFDDELSTPSHPSSPEFEFPSSPLYNPLSPPNSTLSPLLSSTSPPCSPLYSPVSSSPSSPPLSPGANFRLPSKHANQ